MRKFVSAAILREMSKNGNTILLDYESILTPSAQDLVKELGITIQRGEQKISAPGQGFKDELLPRILRPPIEVKDDLSNAVVDELELTKIVQKVIAKTLTQTKRGLKVVHAKGNGIPIPLFEHAPAGQKIGLKDVITARDSNLCAGFMTFDHSELPWHLTYDEIDYVVEGDFDLRVGDQLIHAQAGDIVSIPSDSKVVFSSATKARVFYVTYPANWSDLC